MRFGTGHLSFTIAVLLIAYGAPQSPASPLSQFSWLEGTWERETKRGFAYERWTPTLDGGLRGEATIEPRDGGAVSATESLLLVEMGGEIFYIAKPRGSAFPVAFKLISYKNNVATFENPTHDYPQRIVYTHNADGSLTVYIEGPIDGGEEPRRILFEFERGE